MNKASLQGRQADGKKAEQIARQFLEQQGLKLLEQNYHSRYGEIDLIMQDQKTIVFVEVRYRRDNRFGGALESIDQKKQDKIRITASQYLQQHYPKSNARFDVIAISKLDTDNLQWIQDAFY